MTEAERKKKKKKQQSILQAEINKIIEKSLQAAVDQAMDEIFKDWKYMPFFMIMNQKQ